ncbi:MAG TPA: NfeD family protein [Alloacidobacterium sp.]|nr:NfeD family protein [Alloacidobacterium sp.]
MTWEGFYLFCFALGLCLSAVAFVGGFSHFQIGHFHHVQVGHGGHAGAGHGANSNSISPINGFTLVIFLCWFGGTGYLLERYGGFVVPMVLLLATIAGIAGASVLFWFMAHVLAPHEHALTAEETATLGMIGRVSGAIRDHGTGEILFSQNGSRRFAAARSENGLPIPRDTEVVVMRYEQGIAWVRRWDEVADDFK